MTNTKKLQVRYDKENDIYRFRSIYFKKAFVDKVVKGALTELVYSNLFNYLNHDGIDFYGFFVPEVYSLFLEVLEEGYIEGIDFGLMKEVVEYMNNEIIMMDHDTGEKILDLVMIKKTLTKTPLDHQIKIFDTYEKNKKYLHYRGLLLDVATGGGKTYSAIALAEALKAQKIIVIAPLVVCSQVWIRSITEVVNKNDQIYKVPQTYSIIYDKKVNVEDRYFICSYEWIDRLHEYIDTFKSHKTVVIVDESHNFGDPKSNRSNSLLSVINATESDDILLLSGTPIKSYLTEFINILRFIDKRFKGDVEARFMAMYKRGSWLFNKYALIQNRYQFCSVNVKKSSLVLPKLNIEYVNVELENGEDYLLFNVKNKMTQYIEGRVLELDKERDISKEETLKILEKYIPKDIKASREYQEYLRDIDIIAKAHDNNNLISVRDIMLKCSTYESKFIYPNLSSITVRRAYLYHVVIYKYPSLKAQGEALGNILLGERVRCFKDIALALDYKEIVESASKKVLVFSDFVTVCEAAYEKCKMVLGKKFNPIAIYGDNAKDSQKLLSKFRNDPKVNPLITTYKLLGTGTELKEANVVILINVPYRVATYNQTISRCWRQGQDKKVYVFVPLLDTGEQHNLTTRNIDIYHYFNREVENITGLSTDLPLISDEVISNLTYDKIEDKEKEKVPYDLEQAIDEFSAGIKGPNVGPYDVFEILKKNSLFKKMADMVEGIKWRT